MNGAGPQILGTGAKFKRVPCQKSCRANRALAMFRATCFATELQDKLQETLHNVTAHLVSKVIITTSKFSNLSGHQQP